MKKIEVVNIQLTLRSTLSSLFLASSALFLQSCLHGVTRLWQTGCLCCVDSIQTLFEVFVMKKIEVVNIPLTVRSTLSSLFLASPVLFLQSCLHGVTRLWQSGCLGCVDSIQALFAVFVMTSQHSTDSTFCSKQPLPRVFCALPQVLPTWCDKAVAIWMSFSCVDSIQTLFEVFVMKKIEVVNIPLTVRSTLSSLFLASSVRFLQSCLHGVRRLWQSGCLLAVLIQSRLSSKFSS